jgi:hypothetical protein
MIRTILAAGLTLVAILSTAPAQAQRARVFVASYGSDTNPCTFGSPCKTFQAAVNAVAAGGEVTAIDSAGFGPIFIDKSVTITSPNGVEAGIQAAAGGDAIDIYSGAVTLRGLTLNGAGVAYNGIVFHYGTSLTVTDCVVENFYFDGAANTGNGVELLPFGGGPLTVTVAVTNTTFLNNGFSGISYFAPEESTATVNAVIDHIVATNNGDAIYVDTLYGGGAATVAISNSTLSNNQGDGLIVRNGTLGLSVSIDNTGMNTNLDGIHATGTPRIVLGRSVITNNSGYGIHNETSPSTFYSYQNNQINLNANNNGVAGNPLVALTFQ